MHSNYPVEPIYTRGIELTLVGCLFGVVYLRFGIWSTITAHYVYNAFVVALPMLKSTSTYFQVSGVVVVGALLLPVVPIAIARLTGWQPAVGDDEEEEVVEEVDEEGRRAVSKTVEFSPGTIRPEQKSTESYRVDRRGLAIAAAAALIGVVLVAGLNVERFGDSLQLSASRGEAEEIGKGFLHDLGLDVGDRHQSSRFSNNLGSDHFTHLIRKAGLVRADSLSAQLTHPWRWELRWFKDQEKEEYRVEIDSRGEVVSFDHVLAENDPGPIWSADSARVAVESFIGRTFDVAVDDSSRYELLEAREEKLEARMDHHFVWESATDKVGLGEFRTVARLQGDRFGGFDAWYKAPEEFMRELREKEIKDNVALVLIAIVVVTTFVAGGIYFFRSYRDGTITWVEGFRWSAVAGVGLVLAKLNSLPGYYNGYDTSESLTTYIAKDLIFLLVQVASIVGTGAVMIALCLALYRTLYPRELDPAQWLHLFWRGKIDSHTVAQTVALAVCAYASGLGVGQFADYAFHSWMADSLVAGGSAPLAVNTVLPAVDGLGRLTMLPFGFYALLLGLVIWRRFLGRDWAVLVLAIVLVVVPSTVGPADDLPHFAGLSLIALVQIGVKILFVVFIIRFNLLAYLVLLWFGILLEGGWSLVETKHPFFQINGIVMLVVGLLPLCLPLLARQRINSSRAASESQVAR